MPPTRPSDHGPGLPRLVRLYITHSLIGFGLGAVFVALLLVFDVGGLWRLITTTQGGWLALAMLILANGTVFAGVQFAIRIMRMADEDDDAPVPRLPLPVTEQPQRVQVAGPQRP